eukprot:COSAG06_NODE_1024_length_11038_cov_245.122406_4_plen_67_part_00
MAAWRGASVQSHSSGTYSVYTTRHDTARDTTNMDQQSIKHIVPAGNYTTLLAAAQCSEQGSSGQEG